MAKKSRAKAVVGVVMGSDSDLPKLKGTFEVLKKLGIAFEARVISAHRTPDVAHQYATGAEKRGLKVIIAAAGGAAHLAGVIASMTPLPVIGVPIQTSALGGLDSLLSTVQMPGGVAVATVGIGSGGAKNAAVLAAQILATADETLRGRIRKFRAALARKVAKADKNLKV